MSQAPPCWVEVCLCSTFMWKTDIFSWENTGNQWTKAPTFLLLLRFCSQTFCICPPENSNGQQSKAAILALSFFCCVTRSNYTYDNNMNFLRPTSRRVKGKSSNSETPCLLHNNGKTLIRQTGKSCRLVLLNWAGYFGFHRADLIKLRNIIFAGGREWRYSLHLKLLPTSAARARGCSFGRCNYNSKIPVYLRHWNLTAVIYCYWSKHFSLRGSFVSQSYWFIVMLTNFRERQSILKRNKEIKLYSEVSVLTQTDQFWSFLGWKKGKLSTGSSAKCVLPPSSQPFFWKSCTHQKKLQRQHANICLLWISLWRVITTTSFYISGGWISYLPEREGEQSHIW